MRAIKTVTVCRDGRFCIQNDGAVKQATIFNRQFDSLHAVRLELMTLPVGHVRHLRCPVAGCQLRPVLQALHCAGPATALAVPARQEVWFVQGQALLAVRIHVCIITACQHLLAIHGCCADQDWQSADSSAGVHIVNTLEAHLQGRAQQLPSLDSTGSQVLALQQNWKYFRGCTRGKPRHSLHNRNIQTRKLR